ncbi:PREDICTED: uncharacterized protein LOC109182545 [Ipomoea nil]|uniref:uncharacterized protein LOC109182545 n=1 Tax=Ipomoea nil TaxID=35883 RepID=UPI000900F2F8|nr:PREDICTED: uncharacterized protein LOC109182545 [Ipomoea nil]
MLLLINTYLLIPGSSSSVSLGSPSRGSPSSPSRGSQVLPVRVPIQEPFQVPVQVPVQVLVQVPLQDAVQPDVVTQLEVEDNQWEIPDDVLDAHWHHIEGNDGGITSVRENPPKKPRRNKLPTKK